MDDEEAGDSGFGGLAMFQLGRWSAESSAARLDLVDSLFGPKRPTVNVNQLIANNQALAAENARLRQELANYKHNYRRLKEWADEMEPVLDKLRTPGE